ncbi:hypothetical protein N2W54_006383 [Lotmaria passim]
MLRWQCCRGRLHGVGWQCVVAANLQASLRAIATSGNEEETGRKSGGSSPSSSSTTSTTKPPPQHPMELLTYVFQQHPSALRLHRELTIALASGDAARAADLAGVLATTVQRVVTTAAASAEATTTAHVSPSAQKSRVDTAGGGADSENVPSSSRELLTSESAAAAARSSHDLPTPSADDVEEALEKTREAVLQRRLPAPPSAQFNAEESHDRSGKPDEQLRRLPFWRDPQCLCVTVLESVFEMDVPDGEAQDSLSAAGNRAANCEAQQVRILETYLEKEAARWKAQKAAIAKIVLDVARRLQITPEDLQSAEGFSSASAVASGGEGNHGSTESGEGRRLNVLRHNNLVIRGEVPAAAAAAASSSSSSTESSDQHGANDVDAQLAALGERMSSLGTPLTPEEVQMARFELQMSQSKMRYVVGVHRDLQLALDNRVSAKQAIHKHAASLPPAAAAAAAADDTASSSATGTQLFIDEVIRALNEGSEAFSARATAHEASLTVEDVSARQVAETPVVPFTFMLKCCLWFDTTPRS